MCTSTPLCVLLGRRDDIRDFNYLFIFAMITLFIFFVLLRCSMPRNYHLFTVNVCHIYHRWLLIIAFSVVCLLLFRNLLGFCD